MGSMATTKAVTTTKTSDLTCYVVRGMNAKGEEFYYTGKAADGGLAPTLNESFTYLSKQSARSKAKQLNMRVRLTGLWFTAVQYRTLEVQRPEYAAVVLYARTLVPFNGGEFDRQVVADDILNHFKALTSSDQDFELISDAIRDAQVWL